MTKKTIELGDKVKDNITGFTGIVVAKTTWLQGCDRCLVQPAVGKDGKIPETSGFDEPQLTIIKKHAVDAPNRVPPHGATTPAPESRSRGGPRDDLAVIKRNS